MLKKLRILYEIKLDRWLRENFKLFYPYLFLSTYLTLFLPRSGKSRAIGILRSNYNAGWGHQCSNLVSCYYYFKKANIPFEIDEKIHPFLDGFIKGDRRRSFRIIVRIPWFPDEKGDILLGYLNKLRVLPVRIMLAIDQPYRIQCPSFLEMVRCNVFDVRHIFNVKVETQNVVLHIRRGDIGSQRAKSGHTNRWLDNEYYIQCLDWLLTEGYRLEKIFLISEGEREDFIEFSRFNVIWRLNTSTMEAFNLMVSSNILITSKSSFSYYPALLTRGLVLYPDKFWHSYPSIHRFINTKEIL